VLFSHCEEAQLSNMALAAAATVRDPAFLRARTAAACQHLWLSECWWPRLRDEVLSGNPDTCVEAESGKVAPQARTGRWLYQCT
jgi:hypothetical protein